jgi:hypothetical protein
MENRLSKILGVAALSLSVTVPLMGANPLSAAASAAKADHLARAAAASKVTYHHEFLVSVIDFDAFLQANPTIAKAISTNPMLITNKSYLTANSALSAWLTAHPQIAKEIDKHPERFVRMAVLVNAAETFQAYLAANPKIADMLKVNPQLVTSKAFMAKYPDLSTWLAANPEVATDLTKNPKLFLKLTIAINRYDATTSKS